MKLADPLTIPDTKNQLCYSPQLHKDLLNSSPNSNSNSNENAMKIRTMFCKMSDRGRAGATEGEYLLIAKPELLQSRRFWEWDTEAYHQWRSQAADEAAISSHALSVILLYILLEYTQVVA
ncbi:hypothetical protein B7494_g2789 [Chlorociboria aeruginascens]|nr:hypothetical protein B7494_g2789 [Chlorociboria aeruginascens]